MNERTTYETGVLAATGLVASYGGIRALHVPALSVSAGEIVGVIGANGAGKSTLVNSLAGWSRGKLRTRGRVLFNGAQVENLPPHERARRGLQLVPEGRLVFSRLSVEENLSTAFDPVRETGRHLYSRDDIYQLFPRLEERRHHLGAELSGGERQMLGIGRALMMGPRALMLDEPSIGLAPQIVAQVLETMRTLARNGLAILLVEQNVRAALKVVDRLVVLERGAVVLEGAASEIGDDPRITEAYLGATAA